MNLRKKKQIMAFHLINCEGENMSYPVTTTVKSNKFQLLRKYDPGCNIKPAIKILKTDSPIKIASKYVSSASYKITKLN